MKTNNISGQQQYKIIFTGPVGAGKTTAITSLSDTPPLTTDEKAHDMVNNRKDTTTVAMDYGVMSLDNNEKIHLYGTPGQERFSFMWDILTEGGIGLILLLDNSRSDPFRDMQFFLNAFEKFISENKIVVGVTFMDQKSEPTLYKYSEKLRGFGYNPPLFEVDAREYFDVSLLVQSLLYSHDPWLGA